MIRSFRSKATECVFGGERTPELPAEIQSVALRKLQQLSIARSLADLKVPPGNRLERLRGDRAGQHSIRINDKCRICFVWRGTDAADVEIVDYHD